jgi:ProP effector
MLPTNESLPLTVKNRNIAINWLLDTFPKAFDLRNRLPLKSSILEDIAQKRLINQPAQEALIEAFNYYTLWGSYLNALTEGATCFDLNGQPCGEVTKPEADKAIALLQAAKIKFSGE